MSSFVLYQAPTRRTRPRDPSTAQCLSVLFFGVRKQAEGLGSILEHRRDTAPLRLEVDAPYRVNALHRRFCRGVRRIVAHDEVAEARIATCILGSLVGLYLREAPRRAALA